MSYFQDYLSSVSVVYIYNFSNQYVFDFTIVVVTNWMSLCHSMSLLMSPQSYLFPITYWKCPRRAQCSWCCVDYNKKVEVCLHVCSSLNYGPLVGEARGETLLKVYYRRGLFLRVNLLFYLGLSSVPGQKMWVGNYNKIVIFVLLSVYTYQQNIKCVRSGATKRLFPVIFVVS